MSRRCPSWARTPRTWALSLRARPKHCLHLMTLPPAVSKASPVQADITPPGQGNPPSSSHASFGRRCIPNAPTVPSSGDDPAFFLETDISKKLGHLEPGEFV